MLGNIDPVATIAVKDLDVARRFYEGTLRLTSVHEQGEEVIVFRGGSSSVNVYRSEFAGTNQATAVTWSVGGDLERIVGELEARGVAFEHYDMPGTRDGAIHRLGDLGTAWFKDPDGNIHNLVG